MMRAPIPKQAAVWLVGLVAGVLGSLLMVHAEARADTTPPTITARATIGSGAGATSYTSGFWINEAVTVHFDCESDVSPILFCPPDQTFTTDGQHRATGVATDEAGNTSGAVTFDVYIDTTPPTVLISNIVDGETYVLGYDLPMAMCATSDDVSGVASIATLTLIGGPLGVVNASCSGASDGAGNMAPAVTASYFVQSPNEGLDQAIADFLAEEQQVAKALTRQVSRLAAARTEEAWLRIYAKFVRTVTKHIDRTLTDDEAAYLIALAGLT